MQIWLLEFLGDAYLRYPEDREPRHRKKRKSLDFSWTLAELFRSGCSPKRSGTSVERVKRSRKELGKVVLDLAWL
jgi:hypothetical protein